VTIYLKGGKAEMEQKMSEVQKRRRIGTEAQYMAGR
jgi:hypothetical protein